MNKPGISIYRKKYGCSIAVFLIIVTSASLAYADNVPLLRPGLWEISRNTEDNSGSYRQTGITTQKCTDPSSDMKKMNEKNIEQGCEISSSRKNSDTYESTSVCTVFGKQMKSHGVITVVGDSAYKSIVAWVGDAGSTTEILTAKRLGNCAKKSG